MSGIELLLIAIAFALAAMAAMSNSVILHMALVFFFVAYLIDPSSPPREP